MVQPRHGTAGGFVDLLRMCLSDGSTHLKLSQADAFGAAMHHASGQLADAGSMTGSTVFTQVLYRDNAAGGPCTINVTNGEMAALVY